VDDVLLYAENHGAAQRIIRALEEELTKVGLRAAPGKSHFMATRPWTDLVIGGYAVQQEPELTILGSTVQAANSWQADVAAATQKARKALYGRKAVLCSRLLDEATRVRYFTAVVTSAALSNAAWWRLTVAERQKLDYAQERLLATACRFRRRSIEDWAAFRSRREAWVEAVLAKHRCPRWSRQAALRSHAWAGHCARSAFPSIAAVWKWRSSAELDILRRRRTLKVGSRQTGRPKRFQDTWAKALGNDWEQLATDRRQWSTLGDRVADSLEGIWQGADAGKRKAELSADAAEAKRRRGERTRY